MASISLLFLSSLSYSIFLSWPFPLSFFLSFLNPLFCPSFYFYLFSLSHSFLFLLKISLFRSLMTSLSLSSGILAFSFSLFLCVILSLSFYVLFFLSLSMYHSFSLFLCVILSLSFYVSFFLSLSICHSFYFSCSWCYKTFFWRKSRKSRFPPKLKQQELSILKIINSFVV